MARAGKGKRWKYQLGVGRVRVPGKRRIKSPGFGAIRRRMSRDSRSAGGGGISFGGALLAVMTGGLSLFFRGSPFSGAAKRPQKTGKSGSTRNRASFVPHLQVALQTRTAAQVQRAQKKVLEVEAELEEVRHDVLIAEQLNRMTQVANGKKRILQLHKLQREWAKQLEMLQAESSA